MRVLVTGGTGYVGCHTVAALAGQGHLLSLLTAAVRQALCPASIIAQLAGHVFISGDLCRGGRFTPATVA